MLLERITKLCQENNISIYRLEQEIGFANGTIRLWDKSSPRANNLKAVADYFGCTVDELLREEA